MNLMILLDQIREAVHVDFVREGLVTVRVFLTIIIFKQKCGFRARRVLGR